MRFENRIKTIYFDLDGPILDVSRRYFFVHANICRHLGIKYAPDYKDYWRKKRMRMPFGELIGFLEANTLVNRYVKEWVKQIEKDSVLELDKVFPYVEKVLSYLKNKYDLVIVTQRRRRRTVLEEISKLNLKKYFKDILVGNNQKEEPHISKYRAVIEYPGFNKNSVFVGDTEADINAAKMLKIRNIAVLSGIRNRGFLENFEPDYIIKDIRGLVDEIGL
ncbi:MAG: HAD family hydrolase [Candidatus Omnitrophota bacterium]|nr:MAG: HAD family hydrolase [Candidatus Omnitrophota bacterium]